MCGKVKEERAPEEERQHRKFPGSKGHEAVTSDMSKYLEPKIQQKTFRILFRNSALQTVMSISLLFLL